MHASRTERVGCIEGSSVDTWQEIHPVFFRSTSVWDWPSEVPCCGSDCPARIRPSSVTNDAIAATAASAKDQPHPPRRIRVTEFAANSGFNVYARYRREINPIKTETAHR